MSILEQALPDYRFNEVHQRHVAAPPEVAFTAAREVRPLEVRTLAPLMALRTLPALATRRRLRPSRTDTLLEAFLRSGFVMLGERPGSEVALGAVGRFWKLAGNYPLALGSPEEFVAFNEPGYAKGATNLTFAPDGDGTLVRTETRVACTDAAAARSFGRYWRVIRLGSGLIRISWLNAIARRATG